MAFERVDLGERALQRDRAIAFTHFSGVSSLLLGGDGCLQAQAVVMLCEPSMEGHGG